MRGEPRDRCFRRESVIALRHETDTGETSFCAELRCRVKGGDSGGSLAKAVVRERGRSKDLARVEGGKMTPAVEFV